MLKFKNGAIVAYRDVLAYIRNIDPEFKDLRLKRVFEYTERRLNMQLNPELYTEDID